MDGPTLNPRFNCLIEYWNQIGEPIEPECELCGEDVTGKKVIETVSGFICPHCENGERGKLATTMHRWPMKGVFR